MRFTLADKTARPLLDKELAEILSQPNLLRLAMIDIRDGLPLVHPVWYYYNDKRFIVATDTGGIKAQSLRKNPNVYFLVDLNPDHGPPCGVRGKGTAKVVDDPEYAAKVTVRNILKYLGSLEGPVAHKLVELGKTSSVIEVRPLYMATWKF